MSKSSLSRTIFSVRMHPALLFTSLLLTTTLAVTLPAAETPPSSERRVLVTCELCENVPAGSRMTRLLDHNLTLTNFRLAESQDYSVFTVDARDGSVCIGLDGKTDFESNRSLRCLVLADESLVQEDPFLQEFSTGLLEEGISAGALKSLSTVTVKFDITILLRDVPEPPELQDANLLVQVFDDSDTEFGAVSTVNPQSADRLQYFIASGDEDDVFRINPDTGTLSLRGRDARHFGMLSTHELVIMAENSSGLSATANVIVSVFNEAPPSGSLASPVSSNDLEPNPAPKPSNHGSLPGRATMLPFELPFGTNAKLNNTVVSCIQSIELRKPENESTSSGKAANLPVFTETESDPVSAPTAVLTLNPNAIDTDEISKWVAAPDATTTTGRQSVNKANVIKAEQTHSQQPAAELSSASRGILTSLMALIIFVISCIASAVALSRASAARKAVLEESNARNSDLLTSNALLLLDAESDHKSDTGQAATQSPVTETAEDLISMGNKSAESRNTIPDSNSATQSIDALLPDNAPVLPDSAHDAAQISELQLELASRDRLIAQLRQQLDAINCGSDRATTSDYDAGGEGDNDSWNSAEASSFGNLQPTRNATRLPGISNDERETDARSSLIMARERLERELTCDPQPMSACNSETSETSLWAESSAPAVATLDESEQLRSELADLFASQSTADSENVARSIDFESNSSMLKQDETQQDAEDSHLDSIKNYLSQLLDRSSDSTSAEDILADRRKAENSHRGLDRRATPEPKRKPVKSFLDAYMSTHGGELAGVATSSSVQPSVEKPEAPKEPIKARAPVDVKSIRESMNSFRAVAIQSVENAVLSHDLRQAKGKVAVRTMLIAGLIAVTIVVVLANMVNAIQFSMLNWLMVAAVLLATAELGLRIHSFRRQRKSRSSAIPQPPTLKRSGLRSDDSETPVE